jgi:hypothetical protein
MMPSKSQGAVSIRRFVSAVSWVITGIFTPADLIDSYHGAFRVEAVELAPKPALLFLYRKGGDFSDFGRQFPEDCTVFFAHNH